MWKVITATTVSKQYRDICEKWAEKTATSREHIQWQCHNFSYRGMGGHEDAVTTGAGHLLFFTGTDTIPSIQYLEQYYGANVENELVASSVLATEHSIQCQYQDDLKYYKRMIEEVAPSGIVSIVSDGYDYWNVIGDILPTLKDKIMNRDGKLVVRPDSGDPVKIICGDGESPNGLIRKGSVEALWDIFGGTINSKGYKVLDHHIGLIYGDSITPERAERIFDLLEYKGFSSENVVFGVGSYSLGYHSRDTFSFALKATYTVIDGVEKFIFKDPKTDSGIKKSQKGMVAVVEGFGQLRCVDGLSQADKESVREHDLLEDVFVNGKLVRDETLSEIRARVLK
jgi:nicotinamide phosphoribosyltransferase